MTDENSFKGVFVVKSNAPDQFENIANGFIEQLNIAMEAKDPFMVVVATVADNISFIPIERISKRHIVTLCGSTKFRSEYEKENKRLTDKGFIVLSVGGFHHADGFEMDEQTKQDVDLLHLHKIEMSNSIHVINKGGYIGESTRNEMEFASALGKPITFMEPARLIFAEDISDEKFEKFKEAWLEKTDQEKMEAVEVGKILEKVDEVQQPYPKFPEVCPNCRRFKKIKIQDDVYNDQRRIREECAHCGFRLGDGEKGTTTISKEDWEESIKDSSMPYTDLDLKTEKDAEARGSFDSPDLKPVAKVVVIGGLVYDILKRKTNEPESQQKEAPKSDQEGTEGDRDSKDEGAQE